MKKVYSFLIYLLLLTGITPILAKPSLIGSDSTNTVSTSPPDTIQKRQPNFVSNRIAVKAGDSIVITAVVQDNRQKGRFWRNLGRAIVPSLILNRVGKKQSTGSAEQVGINDATTFGASLAIIPASIEFLQKQYKSKTLIALRTYDENDQPVTTMTSVMTKAAKKDWQELKINYRAEKDGFVEIIGSKDEKLSFVNFGEKNWIQVTRYNKSPLVAVKSKIDTTLSQGIKPKAPIEEEPNVPSMATYSVGGGQTCTAWYWCDGFGCAFVGISCQDQIDFGGNNGGGNFAPEKKGCQECKRLAKNERDTKTNDATYEFASNLALWCPVAAFSAAVSAAELIGIFAAVPEVGQAVTAVAGVIAGFVEYTDCTARHILSFKAKMAEVANNYFKDIATCNSSGYTDCTP